MAAVLLFLLLTLNAPLLDKPHFWDSMTFVAGAHALLTDGFWPVLPTAEDYGHPVLLLEILALVWRVFGESLQVAHLVMLLFAFLTAYGTYIVGQALYGWRTGVLAATLLLFYPLFRAQSSLVLLDLPTAGFAIIATYWLIRRNTLWFVLSASAMVLTKATGIVVLPAALLYVFITHRQDTPARVLVRSLGIHSIPAFVLAAWFWFHIHLTGWVSASENLGWLAVPEDTAPSTILLSYVPRVLLSRHGVLMSFVQMAFSDFVMHFLIGFITLVIIAHSISVRSVRALVSPRSLRTSLGQGLGARSIHSTWGGWANVSLLALPVVLQLGLMATTTSLHRYLLPEYPLFFIAGAHALRSTLHNQRLLVSGVLAFLVIFTIGWATPWLGSSITSPSNAAYLDAVHLEREASTFIEAHYPDKVVLTGWPQYVELAMPEQGYVQRPLRVLAPGNSVPRKEARVQALGGRFFSNPATLTPDDFDLLYYSAQAHPPDAELLRSVIQRFHLTRIVEFAVNANYAAIYATDGTVSGTAPSRSVATDP